MAPPAASVNAKARAASTRKGKKQQMLDTSKDDRSDIYVNYLFAQFIVEKKALGLTEDTIIAYRATFKRFEGYFGKKAELAGDITSSLFIEWTNAMRDEGLAPASINHHLGSIRPFMYWCMEDVRQYLPYFRIRLIKRQEEPPKDYSLDEVEALLKKPDRNAKYTEWRAWTVVSFILGTGARVGTIVGIRMGDIDLQKGAVFYRHTKNKKLQYANLPPQLIVDLKQYVDKWRTRNKEGRPIAEDDYLFCSVSNEQMSRDSLKMAYGSYARSRGVKKTSLHGLRHTFAREWYNNGGDVVQLSKVLGHSSIHMSEHYMNVYANSARGKFIDCNPLENITRNRGRAKRTVHSTE